jgi:hypothetical protein
MFNDRWYCVRFPVVDPTKPIMSGNGAEKVPSRPLSWGEARSRLRRLLEEYLDQPPVLQQKRNTNEAPHEKESILAWWINRDLDLYGGSLAVSVALFVLTAFSLKERHDGVDTGSLHPGADLAVYREQVAASVLLVAGSIASLWTVRRRRFLCLSDSVDAKKRVISRFLKVLWVKSEHDEHRPDGESSPSSTMVPPGDTVDLNGSALTDLYPVYRRTGSTSGSHGSWRRIPSLLLVKDDYVALQVGDIAPAHCCFVDNPSIRKAAGDRIKLESSGETVADVMAQLPRGRTTLPADSELLLSLCTRTQVFKVLEAPLQGFIHRTPGESARCVRSNDFHLMYLNPLCSCSRCRSIETTASVETNERDSRSADGGSTDILGHDCSHCLFETRCCVR